MWKCPIQYLMLEFEPTTFWMQVSTHTMTRALTLVLWNHYTFKFVIVSLVSTQDSNTRQLGLFEKRQKLLD